MSTWTLTEIDRGGRMMRKACTPWRAPRAPKIALPLTRGLTDPGAWVLVDGHQVGQVWSGSGRSLREVWVVFPDQTCVSVYVGRLEIAAEPCVQADLFDAAA